MRSPLFLAVALLASKFAAAQIVLPPVNPVPTPSLVSPAIDATVRGDAPNATTLKLSWIENGVFPTFTNPLPAYFVVCLKPATQAACTFAPADYYAVGAIPSSPAWNGSQVVGYRYTLTLPAGKIPDTLLDVASDWSVGACRSATVSSCRFSAPRALWISAVDLNAIRSTPPYGARFSDVSTTTNAVYIAQPRNDGTRTIFNVGFHSRANAWDALIDSNYRCRIDIDSPDVRQDPDILVFMNNGFTAWVTTLPIVNGRRTAPTDVVGMYRAPNHLLITWPAQNRFAFDLPPGRAGDAVTLNFAVPAAPRPRGFILTVQVDDTNLVREYDESNNLSAVCWTYD